MLQHYPFILLTKIPYGHFACISTIENYGLNKQHSIKYIKPSNFSIQSNAVFIFIFILSYLAQMFTSYDVYITIG